MSELGIEDVTSCHVFVWEGGIFYCSASSVMHRNSFSCSSSALVTEIFGCGMVLLGVAWQLIVRSVSSSRQAGIEVEGREKHGR